MQLLKPSLFALAGLGLATAAPVQAAELPRAVGVSAPAADFGLSWHHGDPDDWDDDWDDDDRWDDDDDDDDDRWKKRRYRDRYYGRDREYYGGERVYRDTRVWRGRDGRVYCRKRDGTTGLIVGGALGALIGRELDRRGDRATGTILGAAGGALLGRELDRGRCR